MALRDEQADILGGPILQRPETGLYATLYRYHFALKSVALFGLGLLVWVACVRGLEHLRKHRELRYRKAMRRKHGIPDSDCRPFAVAYAAAKRAHLEREAQDRKKLTNYVSGHDWPVVDQPISAQKDVRGLRRRAPETIAQRHDYQSPEKHAAVFDNKRPVVHSIDLADWCNPDPCRRVAVPESLPAKRSHSLRASKKGLVINLDDNAESRKRSFDGESDVEHEIVKKSRMDDESGDWYAQYSSTQRTPEEFLDRQPDDNVCNRERSRRVNDLRDEDHEPVDETMEGVGEDGTSKPESVARGRKRDRAEAESSFGGDDFEEDIRNGGTSHHRKRRTVLRRIAISAQGRKRDREVDSPESEGDEGGSEASRRRVQRSPQKKRDKKIVSDEVSKILAKNSHVSKDLPCVGQIVGDEWEEDGIHYKVGNKGERLRLTLVKRARNKYNMPQDSQHPDRSAALEIYVEAWMTDEQYKQAEGRQELAWQEVPRESNGSRAPDILDSPTKNGKSLLWDSVKVSPAHRPFRQSMSVGPLARINPFDQWQLQPAPGRRVASSSTIVSPVLPGVTDSPTCSSFRGFSKWEKQDREAEAMARIRAKIEEQKKAQVAPSRSSEMPTSVTAPELGARPLSVPTITLTPAPVIVAEEQSDNIQQSRSSALAFSFTTPPNATDPTKGTMAPVPTSSPGFSLPSISTPTATSSLPVAPTVPNASSVASSSPFSLSKPPPVPSSAPTTASSSLVRNSFGKGTATGVRTSSTSSSYTLDVTTQPQPPSMASSPKPAPFSFANPDLPSPAAVAAAATKPQVPVLGVLPGSSSSSTVLDSTPPVSKSEVPVSILASATTPENSKPAPYLFSFSTASSSASTATPSVPRFSFGQPHMLVPGPNPAPNTTSQPNPTFKFSQTPPGVTDGTSIIRASGTDESKKPVLPVPVFETSTGLNELANPSSCATMPTAGNSTFNLPSTTTFFGKPATADGDASRSIPHKPTPTFSDISSIPGPPTSTNLPVFSFGGANSGSKSTEESKPTSLFRGIAEGSNGVSVLSNSSWEAKPTFTFGAAAEASKSTLTFGGNKDNSKVPSVFSRSAEGSKPTFAFGSSAETSEPTPAFGSAAERTKSTFAFSSAAETRSTPGPVSNSYTTDASKPISNPGTITFSTSSSAFSSGKDEPTSRTPNPSNTQTKSVPSFTFGTPSSATGSVFGQSVTSTAGSGSSQTIFGKPPNALPNSFGFAGTGASGPPSAFTFGNPTTQTQKQEQ